MCYHNTSIHRSVCMSACLPVSSSGKSSSAGRYFTVSDEWCQKCFGIGHSRMTCTHEDVKVMDLEPSCIPFLLCQALHWHACVRPTLYGHTFWTAEYFMVVGLLFYESCSITSCCLFGCLYRCARRSCCLFECTQVSVRLFLQWFMDAHVNDSSLVPMTTLPSFLKTNG